MAPRPRKALNPKSKDFPTRFALHMRTLVDERGLSTVEFLSAVQREGLDVSPSTVKKWIAGERLPRIEDLRIIGRVLKLKDYRHALPPLP